MAPLLFIWDLSSKVLHVFYARKHTGVTAKLGMQAWEAWNRLFVSSRPTVHYSRLSLKTPGAQWNNLCTCVREYFYITNNNRGDGFKFALAAGLKDSRWTSFFNDGTQKRPHRGKE